MRKLLIIFICLLPLVVEGQTKIFPNAVGYGTESRGAYEVSATPTILYVDTLIADDYNSDATHGSLEWAFTENYPRIVVFERGGVIDYNTVSATGFIIEQDFLTVYGQTAPSPGISILGCEILMRNCNDILIQHVFFRQDDLGETDNTNCVSVAGTNIYNVVFDHCSFAFANDELFTVWQALYNVTLSNSIVAFPLDTNWHANEGGQHEPEIHGTGIIADLDSNITFDKNAIVYTSDRNPRSTGQREVDMNNFVRSYGYKVGPHVVNTSPDLEIAIVGQQSVISWRYSSLQDFAAVVDVDDDAKIWVDDNICKEGIDNPTNTDWENIRTEGSGTPSVQGSSPIDLSEYDILDSDSILSHITAYSGAFYWDRDWIDQMALDSMFSSDMVSINNVEPAPAYVVGYESSNGNMEFGHDWSVDDDTIIVNSNQIILNVNCPDQDSVLGYLNSLLPTGVTAIDHPNPISYHIVLHSNDTGSTGQVIVANEVGQDGLDAFGWDAGTYTGNDGIGTYPDYATVEQIADVPDNPHTVSTDGYTYIEWWADSLGGGDTPSNYCSSVTINTVGMVTNAPDATINVIASGGTTPYTYDWSNDSTTQSISGLDAGTYSVIVTDANGCTGNGSWTIRPRGIVKFSTGAWIYNEGYVVFDKSISDTLVIYSIGDGINIGDGVKIGDGAYLINIELPKQYMKEEETLNELIS